VVVVEGEASMVVVVSAVAVVSMGEVSVVVSTAVAFVAAILEGESAAAEVESASAERASQVEFRTLLAQDRASLHLGIHRIGSLSIPDQPADR
jgi:hypothetical protein